MQEMEFYVPSVSLLPCDMYELVGSALMLHMDFNFAQLLQGENIPYSVERLAETIDEKGEELLKFYLFTQVCMMSGVTGPTSLDGSLFLTEQNAINILNGLQHLKEVTHMGPHSIYWDYIGQRASLLGVQCTSQDTFAFARLICVTRTVDKKGIDILQAAWKKLPADEKEFLVRCFTADGITEESFVFVFLPDYFAKALANPEVGLQVALLGFLDLLEKLQDYMYKVTAMVVTVDLADFVAIIPMIKAPRGLQECVAHMKVVQKHTKIALVLTAESQQAAAKASWRRNLSKDRIPSELQTVTDRLADLEGQTSHQDSVAGPPLRPGRKVIDLWFQVQCYQATNFHHQL